MKRAIYKFTLQQREVNQLELPKNSKLLTVDEEYGLLTLWAECSNNVNKEEEKDIYIIMTMYTGKVIDSEEYTYLGTALMYGGTIVSHVYYKKIQ